MHASVLLWQVFYLREDNLVWIVKRMLLWNFIRKLLHYLPKITLQCMRSSGSGLSWHLKNKTITWAIGKWKSKSYYGKTQRTQINNCLSLLIWKPSLRLLRTTALRLFPDRHFPDRPFPDLKQLLWPTLTPSSVQIAILSNPSAKLIQQLCI